MVMVCQIASYGGSSSYGIVYSGESHLTIEFGSSNRMSMLSNLSGVSGSSVRDPSVFLRLWLVRLITRTARMPFAALLGRSSDMDGAYPCVGLPSSDVHLVPKPFDVVGRVTDDDRLRPKRARYRREQIRSRRLLLLAIWRIQQERVG